MPSTALEPEEYVEQAYFFRVFRERLDENVPAQEILSSIHEEILSTTKLPLAIEFLKGEMVHTGRLSTGMARLAHYFTPFQAFVVSRAEEDRYHRLFEGRALGARTEDARMVRRHHRSRGAVSQDDERHRQMGARLNRR